MNDIREKAQQDRNWLERLLREVPGFRGYLEKEERRETDKLLRTFLAGRIGRLRGRLDDLMRDLTDDGHLALTEQVDRVKRALERIMRRLEFASYGYSGLFDAVKVREPELDKLYEFDVNLVDRITQIEEAGRALRDAGADPDKVQTAASRLRRMARDFDEHLDARGRLIAQPPAGEETRR